MPDPDLEMTGGWGWGCAVSKKVFLALWASVWSKNEGVGGRAPPLDLPLEGNGQKLSELDEIL